MSNRGNSESSPKRQCESIFGFAHLRFGCSWVLMRPGRRDGPSRGGGRSRASTRNDRRRASLARRVGARDIRKLRRPRRRTRRDDSADDVAFERRKGLWHALSRGADRFLRKPVFGRPRARRDSRARAPRVHRLAASGPCRGRPLAWNARISFHSDSVSLTATRSRPGSRRITGMAFNHSPGPRIARIQTHRFGRSGRRPGRRERMVAPRWQRVGFVFTAARWRSGSVAPPRYRGGQP